MYIIISLPTKHFKYPDVWICCNKFSMEDKGIERRLGISRGSFARHLKLIPNETGLEISNLSDIYNRSLRPMVKNDFYCVKCVGFSEHNPTSKHVNWRYRHSNK